MSTLGHPVKYSETPAQITRPAPILGQHSRDVLRDTGYSDAEIEALVQAHAVIVA
jgi:crotonobetainyl-CoA:carnitine CoA-transferase CaiB-like acyl-CoA transferase